MEAYTEKLEHIFHQYLDNRAMNAPTQAIEAMLEFYHTIQILPEITDPEQDMLLFQYGVYDWNDTGDAFEFNITRQVESPDPKDDEYYQLSITLLYEPEEMKPVEAFSSWSADTADIPTWKQQILNSEGFQQAAKHQPYSFRVELDHT
ncbi:hypothetical protein BKI52_22075 [marine bacterium AO1-C]|nr:hypothetical protein BKI52_22075 [marine bacterium AO1-C]